MDVNDPAVAVHDPAVATLRDANAMAHVAPRASELTMTRCLRAARER
jgi:hypothetical protein